MKGEHWFHSAIHVAVTAVVVAVVEYFQAGLPFLFLLVAAALLVFALLNRFLLGRLGAFRSGAVDYFREFPPSKGPREYWPQTKKRFTYLGVSAKTIKEHLETFLREEKGDRLHYRILLMNPEGEAIREQIAFKKGYDFESLTAGQEETINRERAVVESEVKATVARLRNTAAWKANPRRLEIRTYDEFTSWWLYEIDSSQIVMGILKRGQENGKQPAVLLRPKTKEGAVNLFTAIHEDLERIWRSAQTVS